MFGACALVLSTNHPLVLGDLTGDGEQFISPALRDEVDGFCQEAAAAARAGGAMTAAEPPRPKGVFTGRWATNPT